MPSFFSSCASLPNNSKLFHALEVRVSVDAVLDDGLNHQTANALGNEFETAMQPAVIAQAGFLDLFGAEA